MCLFGGGLGTSLGVAILPHCEKGDCTITFVRKRPQLANNSERRVLFSLD
jgi:hypothetical protein